MGAPSFRAERKGGVGALITNIQSFGYLRCAVCLPVRLRKTEKKFTLVRQDRDTVGGVISDGFPII